MEFGLVGSRPYIEVIHTDRCALETSTWAKTNEAKACMFLMKTISKIVLDGKRYGEDRMRLRLRVTNGKHKASMLRFIYNPFFFYSPDSCNPSGLAFEQE